MAETLIWMYSASMTTPFKALGLEGEGSWVPRQRIQECWVGWDG